MSVREDIIRWNAKFPLDRWWRQKHKVAFGSHEHLSVSQYDILFEYVEDQVFKQLSEHENNPNKYYTVQNNIAWLKASKFLDDNVDVPINSIDDLQFDEDGNIILAHE